MKKKNVLINEQKPIELDPEVERILNRDEEFDFTADRDEDFSIPFESAMEP